MNINALGASRLAAVRPPQLVTPAIQPPQVDSTQQQPETPKPSAADPASGGRTITAWTPGGKQLFTANLLPEPAKGEPLSEAALAAQEEFAKYARDGLSMMQENDGPIVYLDPETGEIVGTVAVKKVPDSITAAMYDTGPKSTAVHSVDREPPEPEPVAANTILASAAGALDDAGSSSQSVESMIKNLLDDGAVRDPSADQALASALKPDGVGLPRVA
ncbi:hypothetical protein GCM10011380_09140 [Sphingomonas metalli]|uniref:Uncharacterized protein n=1 Tax=Sphingomonas metalli TaxID=1779358 RepID=A0A916SXC0_9SPHN|nr:hypothetical protein [Sphingomonas metalli]GGB21714.1 hypothetical protein GCM10011380_09140 [Sphingomonas metalli]